MLFEALHIFFNDMIVFAGDVEKWLNALVYVLHYDKISISFTITTSWVGMFTESEAKRSKSESNMKFNVHG